MEYQLVNQLLSTSRGNMGCSKTMRMGQFFICYYTPKVYWPELFYEESKKKSLKMIQDWLTDNCYIDTLPPINLAGVE